MSPRSGFPRTCAQMVDFPVPQGTNMFSKCPDSAGFCAHSFYGPRMLSVLAPSTLYFFFGLPRCVAFLCIPFITVICTLSQKTK